MNIKTLATASLFSLLSLGTVAAQADDTVPVQQYRYGQQLDVHKVLALHEDSRIGCGVVNAQMDYLDSQGKEHRLQYLKFASDCNDGG
ncbi:DUF2790 domain-containing protein [Pseudomonas wadenswilerensis]|jgi:hypothetical protein|uniref:Topoisomerase II n=1 Tax=Pseudomonas wadenswilerensis TaxID=1785161 RepID=A0A380T2T1_9PSED|nr:MULTISPECIES: DUF2790 domain-containing protein [Pseudomonas]MCE5983682.1 DUF2790 domain-containing protein [Pseudomonas sp. LF19]MCP6699554.1 DUF2790 domain-containing protein [Pseudomonas donghuensis]UVM23949.1 DUF2790 domain-containing protein [Pseudomonas wadenswilerensis]SPO66321.1 conserved exported protein of unknown function [Pseudomonas sp. JV241A]SUQ63826.1 hypothetical protein CCOS864_03280 [Pseudomonas wadenswilerensis]